MVGLGGKLSNSGLVYYGELSCDAIIFDDDAGDWKDKQPNLSDEILTLLNECVCDFSQKDVLSFKIKSNTPFVIVDPDRLPEQNADKNTNINIPALRDDEGLPVLPASSLYGVLRSRAAWLGELQRLRANKQASQSDDDVYIPFDDKDLTHKLDGAVRQPRDEIKQLTSVERLFGVSGFRGLLNIGKFERSSQAEDTPLQMEVVNVAIDRFTGGGIDGALFTAETSMNCAWEVSLTVDIDRATEVYSHCETGAEEQDSEILNILRDDIFKNGLMLGHASSRGLGWFDVSDLSKNNGEGLGA